MSSPCVVDQRGRTDHRRGVRFLHTLTGSLLYISCRVAASTSAAATVAMAVLRCTGLPGRTGAAIVAVALGAPSSLWCPWDWMLPVTGLPVVVLNLPTPMSTGFGWPNEAAAVEAKFGIMLPTTGKPCCCHMATAVYGARNCAWSSVIAFVPISTAWHMAVGFDIASDVRAAATARKASASGRGYSCPRGTMA